MQSTNKIVTFTLGELKFAIALAAVEKIYPLAAITPLPKAPEIVLGLVNIGGRIIPVVDTRRRFRVPGRAPELSDRLILAHTSRRPVALVVDAVDGVREVGENDTVGAPAILPETEYVAGVVKLADGMILIHDLDTFLSLEEEKNLGKALEG